MENGVKISQLTEAQSTSDNMYIPVIEANANFKIKVDTLLDSVETGDSFPSGGSVGQVLKKTSTGVEWADDKDTVTTWDNLSGKPQTFTPSQHNHTKSEITDLNKATSSEDGLMSKEDKQKLDTLENVDEYILPKASSIELGGVKIGYNTNAKKYAVQLDGEDKAYVEVPWTDNDTTYNKATTTTDGLMSKEDKLKLNGLGQTGDYVLPVASEQSLGGVKTGYTTSDKNYGVQLDGDSKMYVNVPWTDTNTTYQKATTATAGLMSTEDKNKLDGIEDSATNVQWQSKLQEGVNIGTITINGEPTEVYAPTSGESVTDGNTTYTFANGADGSFTVTPSDGVAQKVTIGKPSTAGTADVANSIEWNNIQSKPLEFTPSSHTHTISNITDFPSNATQYKDGLMSSSDKTKLDSLPSSIEPYEEELFIINPSTDFELSAGINYIKQQVLTNLQEALSSKVICLNVDDAVTPVNVTKSGNNMALSASSIINDSNVNKISTVNLKIDTTNRQVTMVTGSSTLDGSGDGTKYLSDNGTYKTIEIPETVLNTFTLNLDDSSQATNTTPYKVWTINDNVRNALEEAVSQVSLIFVIANDYLYIATYTHPRTTGTVMHRISLTLTHVKDINDTSDTNVYATTQFLDINFIGSYPYNQGATATLVQNEVVLQTTGLASQFLAADGTYKTVSSSVPSIISVNEIQVNRNGQFTFNYRDDTGDYHYTMTLNSSKGLWIYDFQSGNAYRSLYIKPGEAIYPEHIAQYPVDLGKNTADNKFRNCYLSGSVNQSSDICLKENIKPIDAKDNLRLVEFTWKDTKEKGYGAIAQEVEKYYPELVVGEDGQKSVNYIGLHTIKIAQLENEIKELKKQIEILINK